LHTFLTTPLLNISLPKTYQQFVFLCSNCLFMGVLVCWLCWWVWRRKVLVLKWLRMSACLVSVLA